MIGALPSAGQFFAYCFVCYWGRSHGSCEPIERQIRQCFFRSGSCNDDSGLRHRLHGQGLGAGPRQDAARAAADLRRSRGAEHRVLAGRRRQRAARRARRRADAGIAGYAAYGPPGSEDFFRRTLPGAIGLIEAWLPNFGDCLLHTIEEIFARGHASAVVLNSDSPTLPTALLIETAEALARAGRPCRARSVERRRLLSARAEDRAPPYVRETSPGAPSASPNRRLNGRARSISTCIGCRSGTMSTMSTACAGCTPNFGPARCGTAARRQEPAASRRAHGGIDEQPVAKSRFQSPRRGLFEAEPLRA